MKLNLLKGLEASALSRIAHALERLATVQENSHKLALLQAGITPGQLRDATAHEPTEHPLQVAKANLKDALSRLTGRKADPAGPVVLNQSGEDLDALRRLAPESPEFRAELARQFGQLRESGGYMDAETEEMARQLGLIDDRVGPSPHASALGSIGLPEDAPRE